MKKRGRFWSDYGREALPYFESFVTNTRRQSLHRRAFEQECSVGKSNTVDAYMDIGVTNNLKLLNKAVVCEVEGLDLDVGKFSFGRF